MAALQSGTLKEQVQAARSHLQHVGGREGLGRLFEEHQIDVIAAPGDTPLSSLAAAAGVFYSNFVSTKNGTNDSLRLPNSSGPTWRPEA